MKNTWTRISALILSILLLFPLAAGILEPSEAIQPLSTAKTYRLSEPDVEDPTNSASGVTVRWEKVKGAKGYYIYRKAGSAKKWTKVKTIKGGSILKWTDTKAKTNGTLYRYTVKAYSGSTVSQYDSDGEEIYFLSRPAAPTVKKSGSGFSASWKKNSKASSYQLQYSTSSKFTSKTTKTVSGTSLSVSDLKNGKKYYIRVRSIKTVGDDDYYSAWSKASSVTTANGSSGSASSSSKAITASEAKQIALKHAGFSANEVRGLTVEKDSDDGVSIFEVEFRKGNYEYTYEIAISSGKIIEWDKDYDD